MDVYKFKGKTYYVVKQHISWSEVFKEEEKEKAMYRKLKCAIFGHKRPSKLRVGRVSVERGIIRPALCVACRGRK